MGRKDIEETAEALNKVPIVKSARNQNTAVLGVPESATLPADMKRTS